MPGLAKRGLHHLAVLVAALVLLAPQGVLADPVSPPAPPVVDPSEGLLPEEASGKAVEMVRENVVTQGGRYHNVDDARVATLFSPMAAASLTSGDYRIDALLSGYQWTVPTITYSFYSSAVFRGDYYGPESGVREVSDGVKANVRQIMAWYGALLNVNLVEVAETPTTMGLIRILSASGTGYAYAYYPIGTEMFSGAGDVILDPNFDRLGDTNGFQHPAGTHGYVTLIHEIGHALGLKHPFESVPNLPPAEDNTSFTVMTYAGYGSEPATPMTYDLMALQYLYGARPRNAGSDTYSFTSRGADQYTIGSQLFLSTPYTLKQTIWDSAGNDTLDFSGLPADASGYRLDLKGGGWLTSRADYYSSTSAVDFLKGTSLGVLVSISTVINSSSSDTIYANASSNVFKGYGRDRPTGQDLIYDADSADTVDLSGYSLSEVTRTQIGNDLVLGFGANGSVTLNDYFLGKQPQISFTTIPPANTAPVAAVKASPSSGVAPLAVSFDGSGSIDADGTIASYAWTFGDGSSGTGPNVQHGYADPGNYTAVLSVTDNAGATATAQVAITVQQAPVRVAKIGAMAISVVASGKNGKAGQVVVSVTDLSGAPVAGATVAGKWSGLASGSSSGTTGADGRVMLTSKSVSRAGTLTFTITGVTAPAGYTYDSSQNAAGSISVSVPK